MKTPSVTSMFLAIMALTIFGQAKEAQSKCAFALVGVNGKIFDVVTKKTIDAAEVIGFIDGDGVHFSKDTKSDSVTLKTSGDGTFAGEFWFDRYSGLRFFIFPDACDKKPDKIELIIVKDGYLPGRKKVKIKNATKAEKAQRNLYDYVTSPVEIGLIPLNPSCQEAIGINKVQPAPRPAKGRSGL